MFVSLDLLTKQRRELDAAEAAWLEDVAEYDRSGDYTIDNFSSAASTLRHACNIDGGVAHRYVALARKLARLPVVSAAFAAGEISPRHAQVVADAFTPGRADEIANCEPALVEQARLHPPKVFAAIVRRFTDAIDGDGGAGSDETDFDRRALYSAKTLHGAFDIQGNGDQLSGECIDTALNTEMARDLQEHDPRTTPKRRFDALTAICRLYLEQLNPTEAHGVRPHVSVVVDVEELSKRTPVAAAPTGPGRHTYSQTLLELLTCDCEISRIILSGRSEVLDVGRATRTVSAAQWKAIVARDRHCRAPGCNRPPDHCEGHHVEHWSHGGATDLSNLQLLCWHHHRERHVHDARARAG